MRARERERERERDGQNPLTITSSVIVMRFEVRNVKYLAYGTM